MNTVIPTSTDQVPSHVGPVALYEPDGTRRFLIQDAARLRGWDGIAPVMFVFADGTVKNVEVR